MGGEGGGGSSQSVVITGEVFKNTCINYNWELCVEKCCDFIDKL